MTFSPTVLGAGIGGFAFLQRTREAQQDLLAKSPQIARETEGFRDRIADIETAEQLLDDRALLKVALGAFGLDDDIGNRAFLQQVLDSDLSDSRSLANRLADKRYLEFARTFNFMGESGPSINGIKTADDVHKDLANVATAEALLGDRSLLRATLGSFGLEADMDNTFFLRAVLESDLTDEGSFANRLSDPRYGELSRAFDLGAKARQQDTIYGFASLFPEGSEPIRTSDDLLNNEELLAASLKIFGLEADIDRAGFLETVLNSDPDAEDSFANQLDDKRYAALAGAFGFADRAAAEADGAAFESRLEKFVTTVSYRPVPVETPQEFLQDFRLMLATFEFFDLPSRADSAQFADRILRSDRSDPTSLINVFPDERYRAFSDALNLGEPVVERTYPPGFADAIVDNYLERQFEIRIGESEPAMRFALSLERDLTQTIAAGPTNNARWFGIMSSKPLREVFETAFQLPQSFGTLDIDTQLGEFKMRAERYFGTESVADFANPDTLDALRERYLARSQTEAATFGGSGNVVLSLLSGA